MPQVEMRKCVKCGVYTLQEKCPRDGSETRNPHPAKFSIVDKYAEYRRKAKYG
ncbi:MAG TPA: RNA-protein complex protein Nop10 [Candidatus Norongarragalinales archaeon]|nr:RNA-protein complex protein Nop10 [Candidatus Norongarragalinales archaeon]